MQKNMDLVATNISKNIGEPSSIKLNLKDNNFPESYDLKIP